MSPGRLPDVVEYGEGGTSKQVPMLGMSMFGRLNVNVQVKL